MFSSIILTTALLASPATAVNLSPNSKYTLRTNRDESIARELESDETEDDCFAKETGAEIYRDLPISAVDPELTSLVDTATCSYKLTLSFTPDDSLPFMAGPTDQDFLGLGVNPNSRAMCDAERASTTLENHRGTNEFHTTYLHSLNVPEESAEKIGFKSVTLDASPCGTGLNPFPVWGLHFYTFDDNFRRKLRCVSGGDSFCHFTEFQCSKTALDYNMEPGSFDDKICGATEGGFPLFQNQPPGYIFTTDNAQLGANGGFPLMGLHALDVVGGATSPDRDRTIPRIAQVNYNKEIVATNIFFWSGISNGHGQDYVKNHTYSCPTDDRNFLPKQTEITYNNGRTFVSVSGELADCSGPSFTETVPKGPTNPKNFCENHSDCAGVEKCTKNPNKCKCKNKKCRKKGKNCKIAGTGLEDWGCLDGKDCIDVRVNGWGKCMTVG